MVVAQIVESDAPGGTERLVIQIAQDLRRRGHDALVIGPANPKGDGWLGGVLRGLGFDWYPVPRRWMLDPRAVGDVVGILRRRRVDAVHSHEFAPSVYGAAAAWMLRKPHVMTMHSNLYFAGAWRRRVAFRWAARRSAVVAVSRDTLHDADRVLRLGSGAIQVIPNGVAVRPGNRNSLRTELGLEKGALLVVALGNVSPRKAHIILLHALLKVARRNPQIPWHLAIAGTDQGSLAELQDVVQANGLHRRVHFLGHRSDTEDVLAASDIFAMSSLHEGMPLAIMEAMFAGKPVISSTAGGIAEMITDGTEGLLVPVGEVDAMSAGLERLLSDTALRERLATAARARADRQFGIAPMMDAYMRLYGPGSV